MTIKEIRTMNTNEELPEFFYIFGNRNNKRLVNRIECHNIELRNGTLVSSGFGNVVCTDPMIRESFYNGDMEYLPFVKGNPTTRGTLSPFTSRIAERYAIEYNLEIYRKTFFKEYPSRLSGIFAFGNYEICEQMADGRWWRIEDVKKYRLVDVGEFNKYIKVVKTNFKVIGLLENLSEAAYLEGLQEIYTHYWRGAGNIKIEEIKLGDDIILPKCSCGTRYEYLIEGMLEEVICEDLIHK